ncbi:hypothetical protein ATCC90586_007002 [Pythium insidiosum]|nr:hypothetical protein ATCC90586_007002 [Pythium insidiosum]
MTNRIHQPNYSSAPAPTSAPMLPREQRVRRDGLPVLRLTEYQTAQLRLIEKRLLEQYLERYESLVFHQNRTVDPLAWKCTRQAQGIRVYKRRSRQPLAEQTEPMMLVFGTIEGTLEDVLYGSLWNSRDERAMRTYYTKDNVIDAAVLYSVEKPSAMDPFRTLAVKWSLMRSGGTATSIMVKDRDFVFLGGTGMIRTTNDERIGYEIRHSLKIPSFPPIGDSSIVRGEVLSCSFFRQLRGGHVEVCHQLSYFAGGDLLSVLAWNHASDVCIGFSNIIECSFTKKLVRAVQWTTATGPANSQLPSSTVEQQDRRCGMCAQLVAGTPRSCALCHHWVCTQCGVKKETFPPLHGRPALTRCFCKTCLSHVLRNDPTLYALREIEEFEQRFAQECIRSDEIGVMTPVIPTATAPRPAASSTTRRHSVTLMTQSKHPNSHVLVQRDSQADIDALAPRTRRRQVSEPPARVMPPPSRTQFQEAPPRHPSFKTSENSGRQRFDQSDEYGSVDTDEARDHFDHENAPPNRLPTRGPTQILRSQPATQQPLMGSARSIATRATRAASDAGGEIMLRSDTRETKWRARASTIVTTAPASAPPLSEPLQPSPYQLPSRAPPPPPPVTDASSTMVQSRPRQHTMPVTRQPTFNPSGDDSQQEPNRPRDVNDMLEELCAIARETYDLTSTTTTSMRATIHHSG